MPATVLMWALPRTSNTSGGWLSVSMVSATLGLAARCVTFAELGAVGDHNPLPVLPRWIGFAGREIKQGQRTVAGYVDVQKVSFQLPDGRMLLDDVSFRVAEGAKVALVGANGSGKTTLLRIVAGELSPASGVVRIDGGLGVMPQFIGSVRTSMTVPELLLSVAPPRVRAANWRSLGGFR